MPCCEHERSNNISPKIQHVMKIVLLKQMSKVSSLSYPLDQITRAKILFFFDADTKGNSTHNTFNATHSASSRAR